MELEIKGGYGASAPNDIEMLEKKLCAELPKEYREFLKENNGGVPVPGFFDFFDKNKGAEDTSDVNRFLSVGVKQYGSIEKYLEVYSGRVPAEYLPIAHDSGGNLILIKLLGSVVGGVFFWDHEYEADIGVGPGEANIYYISKNFDEFLNGLYEIEE
ncbi:SMI1/KNR4 family protein [Billgrantia montanilacus]|uniref:SMI1/KNR4 family protein n=1 Tax=Billgrantia montanilacus TaxID=2282305 RepID=A0A368TMZ1_9GAMM|nr:SMI1/KNR4 family protein [Halomonas montanilacus]RCV85961.1 SMI1/KNR4 family protein [Halomonas montanilacus]